MLSIHDLVAAGDHLIHWRLPRATALDLADALRTRIDRRGRRTLNAALGLLNDRAEELIRRIRALARLPLTR